MPTFSIIIPVYNVEKFIARCIESIISQTYIDWELILIDDGSTDKSPLICDHFASMDNRIKVIHKCNEGVSIARNLGLDLASGEYICFVDSDDYVDLSLFQSLIPFVQQRVECIIYGYDRIHNKQIENFLLPNFQTSKINPTEIDTFIFNLKYYNLFIPLWNKVYKRSLIEQYKLRNFNEININEDLIFNQYFFHKITQIAYIHNTLYHYTLFSTQNCLSQRICDPKTLLYVAKIIRESNFEKSLNLRLSQFDKFYYWNFLRMSYINAFSLRTYKFPDKIKLIQFFLSQSKNDKNYKEFIKSQGKIKSLFYYSKSKYSIYFYHFCYIKLQQIKRLLYL